MANVSSRELILFIGFLLLVPHCVHPLGFPMRDLLDHLPPRETSSVATTIATSHRGEFLAAAHEVPSGANPDSNNSSNVPADYVSAGHVLVPADRDRIC
ncbi:hypothetical protein Tco_1343721 [Tanacetum coccineum]